MKRTFITVISLVVFFGIMLGLLIYEPSKGFEKDAPRFVCIINPGNYYWAHVKTGLEQADKDFSTYTKYCTFTRFDLDEQIRMLKKLEYMQVDGVITIGEPYCEELNKQLQKLNSSGIPIVLVDTDSSQDTRSCYIGTNNYAAGVLAAQQIVQEIGGRGQVAVFLSGLEYANQKERLDGFKDIIAEYQNINLVEVKETHGDKTLLQESYRQLIKDYKNLSAIFCAEATSTLHMSVLLPQQSSSYPVVIGFDDATPVLESIVDGILTGTIVQDAYEMGYEAVKTLCTLQDNPDADIPDKMFMEVSCLTAENVRHYSVP